MNNRKSPQGYITKPMIGIANTDFGLIERCHNVLEVFQVGHYVYDTYRKNIKGNCKPQKAILVVGYQRVKRFLEIFGESIQKQGQVACIKELIEYRLRVGKKQPYSEIEKSLKDKLMSLNQKGILRDYTPNIRTV